MEKGQLAPKRLRCGKAVWYCGQSVRQGAGRPSSIPCSAMEAWLGMLAHSHTSSLAPLQAVVAKIEFPSVAISHKT